MKELSFGHIAAASLFATVLLLAPDATAIPITVTDPTANYFGIIPNCSKPGTNTVYTNCTSTGYLNTSSIAGSNAEFKKSFDAWNATNSPGEMWTLANGGALPGGEFNVSTFKSGFKNGLGGLEIQIDWTYTGADKGDFKWVQGLYDNYVDGPPPSVVSLRYHMDLWGGAGSCDINNLVRECPPLYPYQYADRFHYDEPIAPFPNSAFDAHALLTKADFTTRTLTAYEGVTWGFVLTPEPSTAMLLAVGLIGLSLRATQRSF